MWRAIVFTIALGACGDNLHVAPKDAAPDDTTVVVDAPPGAIGPCLDQPGEATKPPGGQLPCELISPGFQQ